MAQAYGRALCSRQRLPPGELVDIGELERVNRKLLIDYAARYGPIFKGLMERRLVICIVDQALGRRLLKEHAPSLQAVSIQLESLFPHGFMRGMQGQTHRDYRKALMRGLAELSIEFYTLRFEAIAAQELQSHAEMPDQDNSPQAWADTLGRIATCSLIHLFFDPEPQGAAHGRLLAGYKQLGPHGVVWHVTPRQLAAYQALLTEIAALGSNAGGLLGQLRLQGNVDATMLGNLIYMVELGRYDLRGLLRWISRYALDHSDWLVRIAADSEAPARSDNCKSAEAFVVETLRMDQSERLMRNVQKDIVFEGWLIPQGSLLRVCMWETHKQAGTFPRPFDFEPARFCDSSSAGENFSPFGLDHHHCPLAGPVVQIAIAFLRTPANGYVVSGQGAEPAVRGPYHWEPSPGFRITLAPRERNSN